MWRHKNTFAVGGLDNVGYASGRDLLIVLSSQGQGIFDCCKGERIARINNDSDWWQQFDQATNSIRGFDVLKDAEIATSGLYGGDHLLKITTDHWTLMASEPQPDDKPFDKYLVQKIFLLSPDKKGKLFITKDGACELRAFGFSDTGQSFIVALNCEIIIYSRS